MNILFGLEWVLLWKDMDGQCSQYLKLWFKINIVASSMIHDFYHFMFHMKGRNGKRYWDNSLSKRRNGSYLTQGHV